MTDHERLLWIATYLMQTWKGEAYSSADADRAVEEFRASEAHLTKTEGDQ